MLGQSIFENVAKIIARPHFGRVECQHELAGMVSNQSLSTISNIVSELRTSRRSASISAENDDLRAIANTSTRSQRRKSRVDVYLQRGNEVFLVELKTVKPNIDVFEKTKEKLLLWKTLVFCEFPDVVVKAFVAFPYNPEAPRPYARWTLQGMFDIQNEVLVESEFWEMLGGDNTTSQLLDVFENTGIELREVIDHKFREFIG